MEKFLLKIREHMIKHTEWIDISVRCNMCSKIYKVRVHPEDMYKYLTNRNTYVQDIFPYLSVSDRELLLSQTCNDCWNKMFPK